MYEQCDRAERNAILKKMLAGHSVLLYPENDEFPDGLPQIQIIEKNLKSMIEDKDLAKQDGSPDKATDKKGKGDVARAGATFDPKNFKGNVQLFRHLAEMSVTMSRQKFERSDALNRSTRNRPKKAQKTLFEIEFEEFERREREAKGREQGAKEMGGTRLGALVARAQRQDGEIDQEAASSDLRKLLAVGMQNLYLDRLAKIHELYSSKNMPRQSPRSADGSPSHAQHRMGERTPQMPKQYEKMHSSILENIRELDQFDKVRAHREKEQKQLDREARMFEMKHSVTNQMIKKIEASEIKRTILKGSILGGRWNQVVYSGVADAYVQQVLLEERNQRQRANYNASQKYADYLAGEATGELDLSHPQVAKKIQEGAKLGLTRIYDGFSQPKVYKYEQYNRII